MFSWNSAYLFSFHVSVAALCQDCMVLQPAVLSKENKRIVNTFIRLSFQCVFRHTRLFIPFLYKRIILVVLSLGVLTAWYYLRYTQMGAGKGVTGQCKVS